MKYMVMVNGKYMTQVEVDGSACAAEHIVLDEIRYGISAAQAFSKDEMKTNFFFDCLQSCEMVSLEELTRKSKVVQAEIELEISELENALEQREYELHDLQEQIRELKYKINSAKNKTGDDI